MAATPAFAQASRCGVTGQATAPATITYDPFSATGLSQVTIPLILTRVRGSGNARTTNVSVILTSPVGAPAYSVTYQGSQVLYTEGATGGRPRALSDSSAWSSGEISYTFGNAQASDTSSALNLRVTVPASVDLSAGDPIEFDILYVCTGQSGLSNVTTPTKLADGIRINVNVVSALQAYYAGSALDFGEIGTVTTAVVLAAPGTYTSSSANSVRVKSSGPYEVRVQSRNDFRLTFPGGDLTNAAHTIRYKARFLGADITSNSSFKTSSCLRAGVGGANGLLPIRATLLEGGAAKAPSAAYADIITVTLSPVITSAAALDCPSL